MERYEVAIIGAGFAGASSAWHLSQKGVDSIVILEQEEFPGSHSSGLNASMVRQFEEDAVIAKCVYDGACFIQDPPENWGELLEQVGSLILFKHSSLSKVKETAANMAKLGLETEVLDRKRSQEIVPLLIGADFDHAVWTPSDGIVDINNLLWSYLNDAKKRGTELKAKQRVSSIDQENDGSFLITAEEGVFKVKSIVNATGAWARDVARLAGASEIELTPLRRHLYTAEVLEKVDPKWPFVWDLDHQYYFRPEPPGLLLGPCDEEEHPPGVPSTSHHIREMLAEKLTEFCPRLLEIKIAKEWAGLRTFAPDRRFVIGEDPKLPNFYWAAGLGGWGVTSSPVVGQLVADAILNDGKNIPHELKPDRFSTLFPSLEGRG